MRSSVIAAAFAVGALAVPYQNLQKRDMVTETNTQWTTVMHMVTVTAGGPSPDANAQNKNGVSGHRHYDNHQGDNQGSNPPPPANNNSPPSNPEPAPSPSSPNTDLLPNPTNLPTPTNLPNIGGGDGGDSSSGGDSGPAGSSYSDIAVYHHNIHRKNHSASDIAWDDSLAKSAGDIAASCIYAHNTQMDGGGYGQNIAAGVEPNNISAVITDLFYNGEVNYYDGQYGKPTPDMANFELWGHFTQIVWKDTTHFGCATQDCSGKGLSGVGSDVAPYFTVCNYKSPGNYGGQYGNNVGQSLGEPTALWNAGM